MSNTGFNVFNLSDGKVRVLHLSWVAFFITFFMWFCPAALMPYIVETFGFNNGEAKALLFLNVALKIPARNMVGA